MIIGVPKEIKNNENRVGLTPGSVRELSQFGQDVIIESRAGQGIDASDQDYRNAGATIIESAADIYAQADLIVKVKEPQKTERAMLRENQVLFTFLHLAPDPEQTRDLVDSGAVCIAYETVTSAKGGLPLLAPMSKVAGRLAVQAGAHFLQKPQGGMGKLLGGVPGVEAGKVTIIGAGMVGTHAAQIAIGMGAEVVVLDRSPEALENHWRQFGRQTKTVYSTAETLEQHVISADLVIGAVLVPGAEAPKLVSKQMVRKMQSGSVLVDVAIDQGGCFETSHPTTHADPVYPVNEVLHYCVANMPGAVPHTSTYALNNATLPYVIALANKGYKQALLEDAGFRDGLNVIHGQVTCQEVAHDLGYDYVPEQDALNAVAD